MNKIIIIGNLTRDPEVKYTQANEPLAIARYTVAVSRRFKKDGQPDSDFISCVAFGKNGEFAEKYLHKGTKIAIEGNLQTGSYTDKDGVKRYTTDVIVERQEFVTPKSDSGASKQPSAPADVVVVDNIDDDDLPF